jgi:hypothetical protein
LTRDRPTVNHLEFKTGLDAKAERNTPIKPESKDERNGIAAAKLTIEKPFSTAC